MTPTCPSVPHLVNMHLYICSCQSYNLAPGAPLVSLSNDPFIVGRCEADLWFFRSHPCAAQPLRECDYKMNVRARAGPRTSVQRRCEDPSSIPAECPEGKSVE